MSTVTDRPIPPILLVRLGPHGPNGTVVPESRRVCHLVPVPHSGDVPDVLRAYCGQEIPPGAAELLDGIAGMPCEPCIARSPIPAFAMLRTLPATATTEEVEQRSDVAAWWDLGLQPEQKIAARFVLLTLLQRQDRPLSVGEIALWLGQDPYTVNLIMLLHTAVGWIQLLPGQAGRPWPEQRFQLTERGSTAARQLLAEGMTPTFELLADRLGLDTTVVSTPDTTDPGGCIHHADDAPAGPQPDRNNTAVDRGESDEHT